MPYSKPEGWEFMSPILGGGCVFSLAKCLWCAVQPGKDPRKPLVLGCTAHCGAAFVGEAAVCSRDPSTAAWEARCRTAAAVTEVIAHETALSLEGIELGALRREALAESSRKSLKPNCAKNGGYHKPCWICQWRRLTDQCSGSSNAMLCV